MVQNFEMRVWRMDSGKWNGEIRRTGYVRWTSCGHYNTRAEAFAACASNAELACNEV